MLSFKKEDQNSIIEACKANKATHRYGDSIIACTLDTVKYVVKYGPTRTLTTRIHTQPWLFTLAKNEDAICVPQLLGQFDDEEGTTYLVMEFVELVENPPDMDFKIEVVLRWLAGLGGGETTLGPLGGACIVHPFFKEMEADVPYKSLDALDRYIARARKLVPSYKRTTTQVVLKTENLLFTQCNLDSSHFGVDQNGATVIMGFGSMSFVPHSLARYTLTNSYVPAIEELPNKLGWAGEANMDTLAKIAHNLGMTGNSSLGLDENGMSTTPPKTAEDVAATVDDA